MKPKIPFLTTVPLRRKQEERRGVRNVKRRGRKEDGRGKRVEGLRVRRGRGTESKMDVSESTKNGNIKKRPSVFDVIILRSFPPPPSRVSWSAG